MKKVSTTHKKHLKHSSGHVQPAHNHSPVLHISYQLHIHLTKNIKIKVGALGTFEFPAGDYIYTGSAKRNLEARIARHRKKEKPLRWHIDYLLQHPAANIKHVCTSDKAECEWNQSVNGIIMVPGFGASDCKAGCIAHLKLLSK